MNGDKRQTWGLIIDVIDVLEKHGYQRCDNLHTGSAVMLIGHLAHIYEGTQEEPAAHHLLTAVPRQADPTQAEGTPADGAAAIAPAEIRTVLAALDEASDYKRDRAASCADCADQSCGTCAQRLDAARAYEGLASRLQHVLYGSIPEKPPPEPIVDPMGKRNRPEASAEPEAEL